MTQSAAELITNFAIPGVIDFAEPAQSFPMIHVRNQQASARIALHGAQVLDYRPHGQDPVLWLSDSARFEPGTAIRGGVPVCWPWFGPDPCGAGRPAHGFARNRFWTLERADHDARLGTRLVLGLTVDEATRELWPHDFVLRLVIHVGRTLDLSLQICNTGDTEWCCTGALHAYFRVGDIDAVRTTGLEELQYIDQLDGNRKRQQGPLAISEETDRIYIHKLATIDIHDAELHRVIHIEKRGSGSTVVWNPWIDKAASMDDFHPGGHRQMLCVETANTVADEVCLQPGATHELGCVINSLPD